MTQYTTREDLNLEVDEGQKMLCYARHCWPIRNHTVPSGRGTWGDSFYKSYGITLNTFEKLVNSA